MLKLKLNENTTIELTFAYDKVPEGRKQEIKGPKFRRRTSEASLRVLVDGHQVGGVLKGSATNDSSNRFSRAQGRDKALRNLMATSPEMIEQLGWPFQPTAEGKAKLWEKYRKTCTRKDKVQR